MKKMTSPMKLRNFFIIFLVLAWGLFYLSCDPGSSGGGGGGSSCVDNDSDNRGANCAKGSDCDDADPNNWESCDSCKDKDNDTRFSGCDRYSTIKGPDCDDTDINNWKSCATCVDSDSDTWFVFCDRYQTINGSDECDDDEYNWTALGCANCVDSDMDGRGTDCDVGDDQCEGDGYNWTASGCAGCGDSDTDGFYADCDSYDAGQPGTDCDDGDTSIYPGASEICGDSIDQDCDGPDLECICGDGTCDLTEDVTNCQQDCPGTCGDGICNIYFEDRTSCPGDCPDDHYEENDEMLSGYSIWSGTFNPPYIHGCLSTHELGYGVANDDDWFFKYPSMDILDIHLTLSSGSTLGNIDLCVTTSYGETCSTSPGNYEELDPWWDYGDDIFILVSPVSGSGIVYDLCWDMESSCGNGFCEMYYAEPIWCPEDCPCAGYCGDSYCDSYCFENFPGEPEYCYVDCFSCGDGGCQPPENSATCPGDCP